MSLSGNLCGNKKTKIMSVRKSLVAVAAMSMSLAANASVFNVLEFGAKGDGVAKDTAAVQKAVDAANAAGGGEVLLPKGTYLCGSVFLKSGVDFHLADGAVLKAARSRPTTMRSMSRRRTADGSALATTPATDISFFASSRRT